MALCPVRPVKAPVARHSATVPESAAVQVPAGARKPEKKVAAAAGPYGAKSGRRVRCCKASLLYLLSLWLSLQTKTRPSLLLL